MPTDEIFLNPTVKQVVFQIRFPSLFYVESKIGEFQIRIMKPFPSSSLMYRRNIVIADLPSEAKVEDLPAEVQADQARNIWVFKSADETVEVNLSQDSMSLLSRRHKTYDHRNASSEERFRDMIQFAVDEFLGVVPLPIISRIGLRYIDECPVPAKNTTTFRDWYNTSFALDRFPLEDAENIEFKTCLKRGRNFLRFAEVFKQKEDGNAAYVLDFDAYNINVEPPDYLAVADELHELIRTEYFQAIKAPVYEHMRRKVD